MPATSDSGPLIWLAKCDIIHLLRKHYGEIVIPDAVYREAVKERLRRGFQDAERIQEEVNRGWIKIESPDEKSLEEVKRLEGFIGVELGAGERDGIALTVHSGHDLFLTNDESAYQAAKALDLNVKGVLYILLLSVKRGYLCREESVEALEKMLEEGLWLAPEIVHKFHGTLNKLI